MHSKLKTVRFKYIIYIPFSSQRTTVISWGTADDELMSAENFPAPWRCSYDTRAIAGLSSEDRWPNMNRMFHPKAISIAGRLSADARPMPFCSISSATHRTTTSPNVCCESARWECVLCIFIYPVVCYRQTP